MVYVNVIKICVTPAGAEPHGSPAVQPEACHHKRSSVSGYGHVCQLIGQG